MVYLHWCLFAVLMAIVSGKRSVYMKQGARTASLGFDMPPEIVKKLSDFVLSEENFPRLMEHVPSEYHEMVRKLMPYIQPKINAIVKMVMEEMSPEQRDRVKQMTVAITSGAIVSGGVDSDLNVIMNELAGHVISTLHAASSKPHFIGKVVNTVVKDDDTLKGILHVILPDDLIKFVNPVFSSVGTPVFENLHKLMNVGGTNKLMDGPLRTLIFLSNLLVHSIGRGITFLGPEGPIATRANSVVDANMNVKVGLKWWVPETWMHGVQLVCGMLNLTLTKLDLVEDVLLNSPAHNGSAANLYTVRLMLEENVGSGSKRNIIIHNVRAGLGPVSINDLHLALALYEGPIMNNMGWISLADIVFKLLQGFAGLDELRDSVAKEFNPIMQALIVNKKRKKMQTAIAKGIRRSTLATAGNGNTNTMHVFTGISLGGSIARINAMRAKLECEACPVVALTLNSPSVYNLVHELDLAPEDSRPWLERVFSEDFLQTKKDLFTGFVNFVAQHDVIWKLDDPLPGSSTCMYMHRAELAGCRGVTDLGELESAAVAALSYCKTDYIKVDQTYTFKACMHEQLGPVFQCMMKEHFFLFNSNLTIKEQLFEDWKDIDLVAISSSIASTVKVFSDSNLLQGVDNIDEKWMKKRTGFTKTIKMTAREAEEIVSLRNTAMLKLDEELLKEHEDVRTMQKVAKEQLKQKWAELSPCTGCDAEWCKTKDIREYRCCTTDFNDVCTSAPYLREKCRGEAEGETCGGFVRFFENNGRRCQCMEGYCWDGMRCTVDLDIEHRQRLIKTEEKYPEYFDRQHKLRNVRNNVKRIAFEAKIVKDRSMKDAKADPAFDGKWICLH